MEPEPRQGPVTIYDVAAAAGVAPSTVSRAFARPGRVSQQTAERVRSAARELGYRARVTRPAGEQPEGLSRIVGLVVTDVTNPFYHGIVRGAQIAASQLRCSVMLVDVQESASVEREMLRDALPHVGGLVLAAPRAPEAQLRQIARQRPVVLLNRVVPGLASIVSDDRHGIELVLDHLVGLGHREIWYVAGPETLWADARRWENIRTLGRARGVLVQRLGPFDPTLRPGARIAEALIERRCRAAVFFTDQMALGAMKALEQRGVRIPDDIAVVGHGNTYGCALVTPGLTSVVLPLTQLGEVGLTNVVGLGNGGSWRGSDPVVLPVSLAVRGSTAPDRATTGSPPA